MKRKLRCNLLEPCARSRTFGISLIAFCFGVVVLVLAPLMARAAPLYTLDDLGVDGSLPSVMVGFSFSLTQDMTVTDLGIFDSAGDGLAEEHQVGLWNTASGLLRSATVPAGTTAELDGNFRFVGIAPLTLTTGQTYVLGAYYPSGFNPPNLDVARVNATISTASGVIYGQDLEGDVPGFGIPSEPTGYDNGFFGPNLRLTAVPEPTSLALLVLGGMAMTTFRRRNNNQGTCS